MRRALSNAGSQVRLLDADPDLADAVDGERRAEALERSPVGTLNLGSGDWREAEQFGGDDVALYVISGFLSRRVEIGDGSSVELLGPGQVLRPALSGGEDAVSGRVGWQILSPAWLAVLDLPFWQTMAPYPRVSLGLLDRVVWRSRSLSIQLAIAGSGNLPERILGLLWHFAGSYGRVAKRGVILPVNLSHEILAQMVAATRPPVSLAVKQLEREGLISRGENRGFVLHGPPRPATEEAPPMAGLGL